MPSTTPMLATLLLAVLGPLTSAQDVGAEKRFRAMEKRILSAKAIQVKCSIDLKGEGKDRGGKLKGELLLTRENQVRLKVSGVAFGEMQTSEVISDGKHVTIKPYAMMPVFKESETLPAPKHLSNLVALLLPRTGLKLTVAIMPYLVPLAEEADVE